MKILYHHRTASRDGQSTHIEEMIGGLRAVGCTVEDDGRLIKIPEKVIEAAFKTCPGDFAAGAARKYDAQTIPNAAAMSR